jgi:endonuclease/exonuclease/phosphatase family metal-dependent hydrolase
MDHGRIMPNSVAFWASRCVLGAAFVSMGNAFRTAISVPATQQFSGASMQADIQAPIQPKTRAVTQPFSFKVLTVNAHKGFTFFNRRFILHELRDAVRSVAPDIVFLQEVHGAHVGHSTRHANWPVAPQYEFLADAIWPQFAYGRNAVYPAGDHGNAVLSKFPIIKSENRDVSVAGPEKRGLLHCVMHVPATDIEIHAICVHLGLKESHRSQQLDLMCKLVDTEIPAAAPLVIAGDFNDWRVRAHHRLKRCAGLSEVFVHANGRAAKTFPARFPMLRLDRIYVRNAKVHNPVTLTSRPWSHLSDHAPLAAVISL